MKSYEKKHLRMRLFHQNKINWLLLHGLFFSKFHFILPAIKSNVNIISITVG